MYAHCARAAGTMCQAGRMGLAIHSSQRLKEHCSDFVVPLARCVGPTGPLSMTTLRLIRASGVSSRDHSVVTLEADASTAYGDAVIT